MKLPSIPVGAGAILCILYFQFLVSSAFGLLKAGVKACLSLETWLQKAVVHSPSAQLALLMPKGADAALVRWDKYNGVNVAKHLGHFLLWHTQLCTSLGSLCCICTAGERGWEITPRVNFPSMAPAVPSIWAGGGKKPQVFAPLSVYPVFLPSVLACGRHLRFLSSVPLPPPNKRISSVLRVWLLAVFRPHWGGMLQLLSDDHRMVV